MTIGHDNLLANRQGAPPLPLQCWRETELRPRCAKGRDELNTDTEEAVTVSEILYSSDTEKPSQLHSYRGNIEEAVTAAEM
jgi:hypothetical protein